MQAVGQKIFSQFIKNFKNYIQWDIYYIRDYINRDRNVYTNRFKGEFTLKPFIKKNMVIKINGVHINPLRMQVLVPIQKSSWWLWRQCRPLGCWQRAKQSRCEYIHTLNIQGSVESWNSSTWNDEKVQINKPGICAPNKTKSNLMGYLDGNKIIL